MCENVQMMLGVTLTVTWLDTGFENMSLKNKNDGNEKQLTKGTTPMD